MSILRFFMLLSLVIWIGGIIFFAFAVGTAVATALASALFPALGATHTLGSAIRQDDARPKSP